MPWDGKGDYSEKFNEYNLAPIKNKWYEDESNFPCVCYDLKHDTFNVLYSTCKNFEDNWRKATKEEVLNLVVEQ